VDAAADAKAGVGELAADQLDPEQDGAGPVGVVAAVLDADRADDSGPGGRAGAADAVGAAAITGLVPVGHHQQGAPGVLADALDGLEDSAHVVEVGAAGSGCCEIERVQDDQGGRVGGEFGLDGGQL
jgi:hypothetical protein